MRFPPTTTVIAALTCALSLTFTIGCSDDTQTSTPADMSVDFTMPDAADMASGDDLGSEDSGIEDMPGAVDMAADLAFIDMGMVDAGAGDLGPDMTLGPLGTLSGECGEIDMTEITSGSPFVFSNSIDFGTDPYDDVDFARLSDGGQEIINDGNAGGSSIYSEVFAYEVLYRCEMAALLKTENEVVYDTSGKITDLVIDVDSFKLGVSVTRAVAFPRDSEYTVMRAQDLLESKLSDILESSANVADEDAWEKQILHIIADETRHRDALVDALALIDASIKADTIVVITVSEGSDDFLY